MLFTVSALHDTIAVLEYAYYMLVPKDGCGAQPDNR